MSLLILHLFSSTMMSQPNNIDKQKVLRRLKKILALTESSEPGEAAAALHQARAIMDKYGLEMADAKESAVEQLYVDLSGTEVADWEGHLGEAVAAALGISVLVSRYQRARGFKTPKASIIFVAESHKVQIAKYAFETLRRKLSKDVGIAFKKMLTDAGVAADALKITARQRKAYAYSWCVAIREKVSALASSVPPEIHSYAEKLKTEPRKPKARSTPTKDEAPDVLAAYLRLRGQEDGRKVELHGAVGARENKHAQICG